MSLKRRAALLDWAESWRGWILEDAYDSEVRYRGEPLAPLRSLMGSGRTLYLASFSKVLFPGLRLAYLLMPDALLRSRAAIDRGSSPVTQADLARFKEEGQYTAHLRRMRLVYAERRAKLRKAAEHIRGHRV